MFYPHSFEGPIEKVDFGKYFYHGVFLPPVLEARLPFKRSPKLRMVGEINSMPIKAAWMPSGGRHYVLVSKKVLVRLGLSLGDTVRVAFDLDDPNRVDVPGILLDALEDNEDLSDAWQTLTPGKQRGHAYRISSAKTEPTQLKRIEQLTIELLG